MPETTQGNQCFALNCYNYQNKLSRSRGISFHKFPDKDKEPERFQIWWIASRRKELPTNRPLLCNEHFHEKYIDSTGQIKRLRENAVPSAELVLPPKDLPKKKRVGKMVLRSSAKKIPTVTGRKKRKIKEVNTNGHDLTAEHAYFNTLGLVHQSSTESPVRPNSSRRRKQARVENTVMESELLDEDDSDTEGGSGMEDNSSIGEELDQSETIMESELLDLNLDLDIERLSIRLEQKLGSAEHTLELHNAIADFERRLRGCVTTNDLIRLLKRTPPS